MSVTTIYHTHSDNNEDSAIGSGKCNKKQICNVCDAPFDMTRGCSLEKRCPACRFLNLQSGYKGGFHMFKRDSLKYYGFGISRDKVHHKYIMTDERVLYEFIVYGESELIYNEDIPRYELLDQIDEILNQLNEREEAVIRMRFGLLEDESDRTADEMAKELSVTRVRVRQIESSAMKKLKHPKVSGKLKNYTTM